MCAQERLRGFMADAARLPESAEYYRRLIDFCSDWGFNALVFRLTDDQGCSYRFESHPELLTHKYALTRAEIRGLVERAGTRGVDLIPEVESFGHAHYITAVPEHAELSDQSRTGEQTFNGLIPVHPKSLRLMEDLYREVAELFPSRYFHGGCDEVNWGGSPMSQEALRKKSRTEIWADYLNALNGVARNLGKDFIVWGDHVLRHDPEILGRLSKDIVVYDWDYWGADAKAIEATARKVLEAGLRAIGGPAWCYCKWGPHAGTEQLANLDAFSDAYRRIDDPRCLGVLVTNWVPGRYIQNSIWDGIAYTGVCLSEGSAAARDSAFRRFAERHYGAEWNETWADVFRSGYDLAPPRQRASASFGRRLPLPWSSEQDLKAILDAARTDAPAFTRLRSQLVQCAPTVTRNLADFRAFCLCIEYLEHLFWRETSVVRLAQTPNASPESASTLIRAIAERDRLLADALAADWRRGRPGTAQEVGGMFVLSREDELHYRFAKAAEFSEALAREPERFARALGKV